ncbi:MAG: RNase P modulator RnpM [bacterium]
MHQPVRTCIGCGRKTLKKDLLRIVRTARRELEIDSQAMKPGRGAYLCRDSKCAKMAIERKRFERNLRIHPKPPFVDQLLGFLNEKSNHG